MYLGEPGPVFDLTEKIFTRPREKRTQDWHHRADLADSARKEPGHGEYTVTSVRRGTRFISTG